VSRRTGAEREFGDHGPLGRDLIGERTVSSWVVEVQSTPEDSNRHSSVGAQGSTMRCGIYPSGESGNDDESPVSQISSCQFGNLSTQATGFTGAHDCYSWGGRDIAAVVEDRRREVQIE
jgi:hypothetical protein